MALTNLGGKPSNTIRYTAVGTTSYTPTPGVKWIDILVVGGGAGGAGVNGSNSTGGSPSSFGTTLVIASGTTGSSNIPGNEGTFTINSPAVDIGSVYGSRGGGAEQNNGFYGLGGFGASTSIGGGGGNGPSSTFGFSAPPNTGAGGGGASNTNTNGQFAGAGGSSSAVARARINNPSGSYAILVGAGGTGGSGGGNGGSGLVQITEYF